jgi:hypothetical protein
MERSSSSVPSMYCRRGGVGIAAVQRLVVMLFAGLQEERRVAPVGLDLGCFGGLPGTGLGCSGG